MSDISIGSWSADAEPMHKPHAPACDRNSAPIFEVLKSHCSKAGRLLEIGSGTGQHAVYMAERLPHVEWQTSDLPEHHAGIQQWLDDAALPNVFSPIALDVTERWAPKHPFDTVFTANSLHIMSWLAVEDFFEQLPDWLAPQGKLVVYGPFNYNGQFTSASNAQFQQWLQARDPLSGIRDFEAVNQLALAAACVLLDDIEMPANNRCLVWQRTS